MPDAITSTAPSSLPVAVVPTPQDTSIAMCIVIVLVVACIVAVFMGPAKES